MGCVLAFNSDPPGRTEANQLLDVIYGAARRFVGPLAMDDLDAVVERIADELRAAGRRPYVIPLGGSSPLGASAYVTAADEILADLGHDDVLVVTATASGGTHAGLAARLGHERVLGIDVGALADPGRGVRRLTIEVAERLDLPVPTGEPRIVRDQVGDGYGAATDTCLRAIRVAARTEGLLLDPVYSGKAMAGLMALPRSDLQARSVVFLATGGVPALFASRYEAWLSGPEHDRTTPMKRVADRRRRRALDGATCTADGRARSHASAGSPRDARARTGELRGPLFRGRRRGRRSSSLTPVRPEASRRSARHSPT